MADPFAPRQPNWFDQMGQNIQGGLNQAGNWLFGPNSLVGRDWLNPAGVPNPQAPFDQPITAEEAFSHLSEFDNSEIIQSLPPDLRLLYRGQIKGARDQNTLNAFLNAAYAAGTGYQNTNQTNERLDKAETERQGNINTGLQGIDELQNQFAPMMQDRLNRYGGLIADPNKLRSDSEFATQLAQTENMINNQVQQIGKQATLRNTEAGIRASGKTGGEMDAAKWQGTALKGQNIQGILGQLHGLRDNTETNFRNFMGGLTDARNQTRQTGFSNLLPLQQLGQNTQQMAPDFSSGGLTSLDLTGLNLAQQNQNTANLLQGLGLVAGLGDKAGQTVSQLPPFRSFSNY